MTIDARGRAAAADLQAAATSGLDPTAMLTKLERASREKTRRGVVATLSAVVVLLAGGAVMAGSLRSDTATVLGSNPSPTPVTQNCPGAPTVTCLGRNRYRIPLTVPVTVTLPANFQRDLNTLGTIATTLEVYRNDHDTTGVTILEGAIPIKNDPSFERDPAAGTSAQSVATWLAHRPFAVPTTPTRTSVGGLTAYRVEVALKPGAPLLGTHDANPAAPTFVGTNTQMGAWGNLRARYTLVDVPGAGLTVIWSWTLDNPTALAGNQAFIDSISFN